MTTFTQDQIDALKASIAKGVKSVSYDGHTVTYHSLSEMREALAFMEGEVEAETSGSRKLTVANPAFDRGFQ